MVALENVQIVEEQFLLLFYAHIQLMTNLHCDYISFNQIIDIHFNLNVEMGVGFYNRHIAMNMNFTELAGHCLKALVLSPTFDITLSQEEKGTLDFIHRHCKLYINFDPLPKQFLLQDFNGVFVSVPHPLHEI